MLVTVEDGRAVRVTGDPAHPATRGVLCTKVARYTERTYRPGRLLHPLKRVGRKGEGKFQRIEWEEALDIVGSRLKEIAGRDPQRILPYSYAGTMGYVQGESMAQRFFHRLGASVLERTICSASGTAGLKYTYGASLGFDVDFADEAKLILLWGCNPITSSLHYWTRVQEAKRRGARLIAIDPYRSLTAEKCHQHIALLPGTDSALALGMMHVLIEEGLLDQDYIRQHTLGFDALQERASDYPPERVAQICGISAQEVVDLAITYGTLAVTEREPVAIRIGYGLQRTHGGGQAVRALACLPSLVGAWRHRAGGALHSSSGFFPVNTAGLQRPDLIPGWPKLPRSVNMSTIGDVLLQKEDPIEALVVYNSNPVAVAPESAKLVAGFAREDLFTVVLEHFQTDTADYADIVLPATTQLEHLDIHKSYGHAYVLANNPAIEPLGEAKPNSEIFRLLARRMGFDESCFSDSDDMLAAQAINFNDDRTRHMDWETLKRDGWAKLKLPEAPFAQGAFTTPSGKCEFYSAQLALQGEDPLPGFVAPHESVESNPSLALSYPLAMISPPARHFLNSSFVNVDSLRRIEGEPVVDIHPIDAATRGIVDGQAVRVWNDRGSLGLKARLTERARCGVVVIPSIWWKKFSADGKNANELTSQALTDLGKAPTFYDCLVEVQAVEPLGSGT